MNVQQFTKDETVRCLVDSSRGQWLGRKGTVAADSHLTSDEWATVLVRFDGRKSAEGYPRKHFEKVSEIVWQYPGMKDVVRGAQDDCSRCKIARQMGTVIYCSCMV